MSLIPSASQAIQSMLELQRLSQQNIALGIDAANQGAVARDHSVTQSIAIQEKSMQIMTELKQSALKASHIGSTIDIYA